MPLLSDPRLELRPHAGSRRLVVLLHGWMRSSTDLDALSEMLSGDSWSADHYMPQLPIGLFSKVSATDLVKALVENVKLLDRRRADSPDGSYEDIVLVGHSCGAVLVRAMLTEAFGARRDATIGESESREWAEKVSRVVMFAAVNRGFNPNSAMSVSMRIASWAGDWIDRLPGERFFIFNLRRGAAFLTTVRLQWFALMQWFKDNGRKPPIVCQLLGTVDDLVAPTDNIDLATGQSFYYLEAPNSGHFDIVDVKESVERRKVSGIALTAGEEELRERAIPLSDVTDIFDEAEEDHDAGGPRNADPFFDDVTDVVFVVHGIRDYGFWTRKIAARVKRRAREAGRSCRSVTSTYGYFPMGPFLLLTERRKRAEWLMDQYVTARSLYPKARFSYIGHSNGTYLLASAIEACPAITFDRVVFAGSVVRKDFDWPKYLSERKCGPGDAPSPDQMAQIQRVVNYAATADWVVALVPRFCQVWKKLELGDAGHNGFAGISDGLTQIRYVPGDHSAALGEQHWDEIAKFIVDGTEPAQILPAEDRSDGKANSHKDRRATDHMPSVDLLARNAWLIVPCLVCFACAPAVLLLWPLGLFSDVAPVLWALLFMGYCWLVSRILTRI